MATVRNLKIKTSTCKRIVKELHSYEKEVEREAAKTADMKDKGADPYDLKQQVSQTHVIHMNESTFNFSVLSLLGLILLRVINPFWIKTCAY